MLRSRWSCFRLRGAGLPEEEPYEPSFTGSLPLPQTRHKKKSRKRCAGDSFVSLPLRLDDGSSDNVSSCSSDSVSTFSNPTFRFPSPRPIKDRLRIVMIGDHEVGKTCLALRLTRNTFISRYSRSTLQLLQTSRDLHHDLYSIQVLDMGADIGSVSPLSELDSPIDGLVMVYSIGSRPSFDRLHDIRDAVCRHCDSDRLPPTLLIANKRDLVHGSQNSLRRKDKWEQRYVFPEEGQRLARQCRASFSEVSAKTGDGVQQMFTEFLTRVAYLREKSSSESEYSDSSIVESLRNSG